MVVTTGAAVTGSVVSERLRARGRGWVRGRRIGVAVIAASLGVLSAAPGFDAFATSVAPPAESKPSAAASQPVLLFEHAGLDAVLVDGKDAALKRAIAMLPARVNELRSEIPDFPNLPPALTDMALKLLSRPGRVALTYASEAKNQTGGAMGFGLVVSALMADEKDARAVHEMVSGFNVVDQRGRPPVASKKHPGMSEMAIPVVGAVRFGPRQAESGWRYELQMGSMLDPDAAFGALGGPMVEGMTPVVRMRADLSSLSVFGDMARSAVSIRAPEMNERLAQIQSMFTGPDAVRLSGQFGHMSDRNVTVYRVANMGKHAESLGLSKQALSSADIDAIPADACWAVMSQLSWKGSLAELRAVVQNEPGAKRHLDEFRSRTGVDPFADVLENMGTRVGLYMSDTTGGSSLASMVLLAEMSDRAKLRAAMEKLAAFANAQLRESHDVRGYVRVRVYDDAAGGGRMLSLTFPGVPIPFEPTIAMADRWLVLGASPQAAAGAARHIVAKGKGLGSNPAFAAAAPKGRPVTYIGFSDTAELMRGGYPMVQMVTSAITNAMRSPASADREPGMVLPLFGELRAGARASVSFAYFDGDDYVYQSESDRSILVGTAGSMGVLSKLSPVLAPLAAAGMFAAEQRSRRFGGMNPNFGAEEEEGEEAEVEEAPHAPNFMIVPKGRG
ncbi:MAG: hypothetical protein JNM07_07025 [Phycisphaerae bacterium]|nr:hypothetical protein [Phycisphaerae bacterium]